MKLGDMFMLEVVAAVAVFLIIPTPVGGVTEDAEEMVKRQTDHDTYDFNGSIVAKQWIAVPEPVEFMAPTFGKIYLPEIRKFAKIEHGKPVKVEGLFDGTLELPSHKGLSDLKAIGQHARLTVSINVKFLIVSGYPDIVDVEGELEGALEVDGSLLKKLDAAADHYVGTDGIMHNADKIQVEGTISGEIICIC